MIRYADLLLTIILEMVEAQAGRSFAAADCVPEGSPYPGGPIGPPRGPALACDVHAFAGNFFVVEQRIGQRPKCFAARVMDFARAIGLEYRASLEPRDQLAVVSQLHGQQWDPVIRHGR